MTTRRPEEILATHEAWFKDVPEMAAMLVQPPTKGTKHYSRTVALAKSAKSLTPQPFDPAAKRDPVGAFLDAELGLRLGRANFSATIDTYDPLDPMRGSREALKSMRAAITAFGARVQCLDECARIRAEDLRLPPSQDMETRTVIEGYTVDVRAFRSAYRQLLDIEESLDTLDIRRRAINAVRLMIDSCLFSIIGCLTKEREGQILRFDLDTEERSYGEAQS